MAFNSGTASLCTIAFSSIFADDQELFPIHLISHISAEGPLLPFHLLELHHPRYRTKLFYAPAKRPSSDRKDIVEKSIATI